VYPKNSVTPPRFAIGAVIQISDGAVQTSNCTVTVIPFGGNEAAGNGTVAYSNNGVVLYTPTQAESNYASFVAVASKNNCIPVAVTVVPSASPTAGYAVCADTQKVDVETIKTRAITAGANLTLLPNIGFNGAPGAANGAPTTDGSKLNQTVDLTANQSIGVSGDFSATMKTSLNNATVTVSDKNGFALTAAYDAAKTAANQNSVDAVATTANTILADTNELQTDWVNGGRLDLILDAVLAKFTSNRNEPGQGSPAASIDPLLKLDYLYKAWRNLKVQNANNFLLYNDAGDTVDQKAPVSDDGNNATFGKIVSGA